MRNIEFKIELYLYNTYCGLAREVLTGEDLPVSEYSVAIGNTVATLQGYLNLPSDDSGSKVEMEGGRGCQPLHLQLRAYGGDRW